MERFKMLSLREDEGDASLPCSVPWLAGLLVDGGLRVGERTLVYGAQGSGKTTILGQIAYGFAQAGVKTLVVSSELSDTQLIGRLLTILGLDAADGPGFENLRVHYADGMAAFEETVQVLREGLDTFRPQVLILDSLQGLGINSYQVKKWQKLYGLIKDLRKSGIATFVVAHCNKKLQPAGPKSLEHEVDLIISIREAADKRLVFVTKNRNGMSRYAPLIFKTDERGRLLPDERAQQALVTRTLGFDGKPIEIEAKVDHSGSVFNSGKPILSGLRQWHYLKIADILAHHKFNLTGMSQSISCNIPGEERRYKGWLDLPIAISLIGSYIQRPISPWFLFVGELGLDGHVFDIKDQEAFDEFVREVMIELQRAVRDGRRMTVFLPPAAFAYVATQLERPDKIEIIGVYHLNEVVEQTWPELRLKVR